MGKLINSLQQEPDAIWFEELRITVNELAKYTYVGTGTPEGVVVAPLGSSYHNKSGGVGTSLYVKETEITTPDSNGWVAK